MGYEMSEVQDEEGIYKAICESQNPVSSVSGVYVEFQCNLEESNQLFISINDYEREGFLYNKKWVQIKTLNGEGKQCWAYLKK